MAYCLWCCRNLVHRVLLISQTVICYTHALSSIGWTCEFYAHGSLITLHFSTKHQSEIQTFAKTWAPNRPTDAVPKADNFTTTSLFGRPFVKRFALCYRTVVCVICHVLSVCDVVVLWPNGLMDQDATWYGGRPRPRRHCIRWASSSPRKGYNTQLLRWAIIVIDNSTRRWASYWFLLKCQFTPSMQSRTIMSLVYLAYT